MNFNSEPEPACERCRFFTPNPPQPGQPLDVAMGCCRALPPQVIVLPAPHGLNLQAVFPPVPGNLSCGLFNPKGEFDHE